MDDKQEDHRLIQEIAQGSREGFDRFYEMYIGFVYQIAISIVGDQKEAEDVCHDVFLEVFQKAGEYKFSRGSVKAWLAVKTKSRSLDNLRKRKPALMDKIDSLLQKEGKDAEVFVLSYMEREMLLQALKGIPKDQRFAIYCSYFQGKSHREIAGAMNRPLGSIKSLIRYGLNNLRKQKKLLNWTEAGRGEKNNGL